MKRAELQPGDILEALEGDYEYVQIPMKAGERLLVDHPNEECESYELIAWKENRFGLLDYWLIYKDLGDTLAEGFKLVED